MATDNDKRIRALLSYVRRAASDDMIDNLYTVIEQQIGVASERMNELDSTSVDDECDLIEDLLGVAFVTAQTFITHFRTRLMKLYEAYGDAGISLTFGMSKTDVFTHGEFLKPGLQWKVIQVINAVANYWKHHDEWMTDWVTVNNGGKLALVWDTNKMRKREKHTVEIVESIGMKASSTGNIRTAAKALGIADNFKDLSPLRKKVKEWANDLYITTSELGRGPLDTSA